MNLKLKNKKALSVVVATVILVALTLAAVVLVWNVVSNLINQQTSHAKSCFDVVGKVSLNKDYTCFTKNSNKMNFSLEVGDIDLDSVLVSISNYSYSKEFTLTNTAKTITGIKTALDSSSVALPGKNGGQTYHVDLSVLGLTGNISTITIAPTVSGSQCDATDQMTTFGSC